MSVRSIFLPLLFLSVTLSLSEADTFVMKTGDQVEGRATDEKAESVTIQRYVGDAAPFVVATMDLQEVLPDTQETADFLSLRYASDIQTAVGPDVYNQLIDKKIPSFLAKYAHTRYQPELDQILDRLKQEKARQSKGAVKIAGVWLSHDQVSQQKYQVSAALLHEAMEYSVAINDWPAALNTFQNLRTNYQSSRAYVAGIDLALQILPEYRRICEDKRQSYRLELLRNYLNLSATPDHLREELINNARRESDRVAALIGDQRRNGVQWPSVTPRSEKDFNEIHTQITDELSSLSKLPIASYRASIAAAIQAQTAIEGQDPASAKIYLEQARTAWPDNEMVVRLQTAVVAEMATAAIAAKTKLDAERPVALSHLVPNKEPLILIAGGTALLLVVFLFLGFRKTRRSRRRLIVARG